MKKYLVSIDICEVNAAGDIATWNHDMDKEIVIKVLAEDSKHAALLAVGSIVLKDGEVIHNIHVGRAM